MTVFVSYNWHFLLKNYEKKGCFCKRMLKY